MGGQADHPQTIVSTFHMTDDDTISTFYLKAIQKYNCITLQQDKTGQANRLIGIFVETLYKKGGAFSMSLHTIYMEWLIMKRNAVLLTKTPFPYKLSDIYEILTDVQLMDTTEQAKDDKVETKEQNDIPAIVATLTNQPNNEVTTTNIDNIQNIVNSVKRYQSNNNNNDQQYQGNTNGNSRFQQFYGGTNSKNNKNFDPEKLIHKRCKVCNMETPINKRCDACGMNNIDLMQQINKIHTTNPNSCCF